MTLAFPFSLNRKKNRKEAEGRGMEHWSVISVCPHGGP